MKRDLGNVERQLKSTNREMTRFSRGALVGTGALQSLGRAAAFASLSFIGGAGLALGIRSTVQAAMEAQVVLGQTENAVKRAGLSWETYGQQVQDAALAQAQISGFDDERLLRTFSTFARVTKDVNQSLKLNALAANVARGRNIELEQAAQLVLKASIGQAGALRRLGIDARAGASGLELLTLLNEKYAGSAAKFADTAAGAQARFNVAIQNTQEAIGTALLPTLTRYLNKATEWLNNTQNQEKIQRTVKTAVDYTAAAVDIAAGAFQGLSAIIKPITKDARGLGGEFYSIANALGLVDDNTRRVITSQDLLWAAAKRRQLHPSTGIFGTPVEALTGGYVPAAAKAAARKSGSAGTGEQFGSAALTRDAKTQIDLARALAEGDKQGITAAANARLAFVRDTIAFANRLISEGRGDTAKLANTLQTFYGEEDTVQGILEGFVADANRAAQDRLNAIEQRNAEWRDKNHSIQLAFERARKQGAAFHEKFRKQVRDEAEAHNRRIRQLREDAKRAKDQSARDSRGGGGGDSFTLAELFQEATSEFNQYGGNIGSGPLSAQDARGAFAGVVKTHQTTVVQNFYLPVPASQAMVDARNAAKNLR